MNHHEVGRRFTEPFAWEFTTASIRRVANGSVETEPHRAPISHTVHGVKVAVSPNHALDKGAVTNGGFRLINAPLTSLNHQSLE